MNMCVILNGYQERERERAVWIYKYNSTVNVKKKWIYLLLIKL
jgi:hypothetical protein